MLGLGDQVGRDEFRIRGVVGDDRDLGRAGLGVGADRAEQQPLGRGHVDVARAGDGVHGGTVGRAVPEHGDGLGPAGGVDLLDAEQRARSEHGRAGQAVFLRRRGHRDLRHPGHLGRNHVHQHRGRVGDQAARHVHARPAHGDIALGHGGPGADAGHHVGRPLGPADQAEPAGRSPPAPPAGPGPVRPAPRPARPPGPGWLARSTPSKRSVYSRTAAAPRWRTSSQIGRTFSIAASTSSSALGSTGASFSLVSWAADDPRRSILESTRPVYGAGAGSRRPVRIVDIPPARRGAVRGPAPRRSLPGQLIPGPSFLGQRRAGPGALAVTQPPRRVPSRLPSARPPAARSRWRSGTPGTGRPAAGRRRAGWRADGGSWPARRAHRSRA